MPKEKTIKVKRRYHHGDLRRVMLEAAWQLVARGGMAALTLRELAREVGVTHSAPYHHFPTRGALLDALAEQAFTNMDAALRGGMAEAGDENDASARFYKLGCAYVDFARAHPEQLQVMFRARHDESEGPPPASLLEIGARSFANVHDAVVAMQKAGFAPAANTEELVLSAWCLVHGLSKLWVEGPLNITPPYSEDFALWRDTMMRGFIEGWKARAKAERAGS